MCPFDHHELDRRAGLADLVRVVLARADRRVVVGVAVDEQHRRLREHAGLCHQPEDSGTAAGVGRNGGGVAQAVRQLLGGDDLLDGRAQRRGAAAREAHDGDALPVDARVRGEKPKRGERVGHVRGERHLRLVVGGALHAARAEHVEREDRDARGVELLRPEVELRVVDAARAVDEHDRGNLVAARRQEQMADDVHRLAALVALHQFAECLGGPAGKRVLAGRRCTRKAGHRFGRLGVGSHAEKKARDGGYRELAAFQQSAGMHDSNSSKSVGPPPGEAEFV